MKKKHGLLILVAMLAVLSSLPAYAQLLPSDTLTFILSNEAPGHLINELIAGGHAGANLYQTLVALAPASNGVISEAFLTTLASCPAGSEIFTVPLSTFSVNYPVAINADCTVHIAPIYGRDYYGRIGYANYPPSGGRQSFTYAINPSYYIDAGSNGTGHYRAFAIAWSGPAASSFHPVTAPTLSEWGMILLSIAMAAAALVSMKKRQRESD